MNSLNKPCADGVGDDISSKTFDVLFPANGAIVIALLPKAPSPLQRLIHGQTAAGLDSAHQLTQRFILQLHKAMQMIRHHYSSQKNSQTVLLRPMQFPRQPTCPTANQRKPASADQPPLLTDKRVPIPSNDQCEDQRPSNTQAFPCLHSIERGREFTVIKRWIAPAKSYKT